MQEPIAIVGLGCRFPGAENSDEFWRVLSKGENHVIDVTPDRWNVDAWYHPDAPGKMYTRKLGLVKGHDEFDNRLYGISESESVKMDPQQRFVLDSVSMALEDGGFTREHLRGSKTGVYIGSMNTDYSNILSKNVEVADNYNLTGSSNSIVAARVSYVYDLHGPAVTLDTACSSALMATHLASQGLSTGSWYEMKIGDGCCSSSWEDVFLRLSLSNGRPGCLEWGRDEHGHAGKMAVSQIRRVSRRSKGNVHKLEIKSSKKTLKLRARDESEADTWSTALEELTRSGEHPKSYVNRGAVFETDTVTTHM